MTPFRNLCVNLCISAVLFCALIGVRSTLPNDVSYENVHIAPNAKTVSKVIVKAAFATGLPSQEVHDYVVFKTADLKLGNTEMQLIAFPGTKWMRYQ
jgi:hypothetical protein